MNSGFLEVLKASPDDRRDLFVGTARQLGTPEQYVEKDFWVCWTLSTRFLTDSPATGRASCSKEEPHCQRHTA